MPEITLTQSQISLICICIFIGVSAAIIYNYYYKKVFGRFISALVENGAFSPENAKSPEVLGGFGERSLRDFMRGKKPVDVIECDGRYYISEKDEIKARTLFRKGSAKLLSVFLGILATAAFTVILYFAAINYFIN